MNVLHSNGWNDQTYLHQTAQCQIVIGDDTLDLVELCKMGRVDGLVPEDTIDGEVTGRWWSAIWALHGSKLVQHSCTDGRRVRSQHKPQRLVTRPGVSVAYGAVLAVLFKVTDITVSQEICVG